ncbi:unnamed protein product [Phaeothamnion confervicola]
MERYTTGKLLGQGSFGRALLCKRRRDGELCVIKQVAMARLSSKDRKVAHKEAALLATLRHPNIVGYWESFFDGPRQDTLCIVMEFAGGGDLYQYLRDCGSRLLPEDRVLDWLVQITLAVKHLHDRKILHRDLKTQNIFLTSQRLVKLGDFGIAKVLANTMEQARTAIGTPYYMSPEICRERRYDNRSDIWSLGCVCYEMATLTHAFQGRDIRQLADKICGSEPMPVAARYSAALRALIGEMLSKDPRGRPSANAILRRPLVRDMIGRFLNAAQVRLQSGKEQRTNRKSKGTS